VHADDSVLPALVVVVPDGHGEQLLELAVSLKLPCGQSTQAWFLKENCCPIGQNDEEKLSIHASTSAT
jgi:hypothetical protein